MNLNSLKGFSKTNDALKYAKSIEARFAGGQPLVSITSPTMSFKKRAGFGM